MQQRTLLLSILLVAGLVPFSEQYFLNNARSWDKPAKKLVCQYHVTDRANSGKTLEKEPYFKCANEQALNIFSAGLITTDPRMCPLQYTYDNEEFICPSRNYANQDATRVLKELCNGKTECIFTWSSLPYLQCVEKGELVPIPFNNQALNITYKCIGKRDHFTPFSNKRYDFKFTANLNHPQRKLSYNRLQNLPGPGMVMPLAMPIPQQPIVVQVPQPQQNYPQPRANYKQSQY